VPELPEVETVRRIIDRNLTGKKIVEAEVIPDEIVLKGVNHDVVQQAVIGRTVTATGRKGKYFWIEFDQKPMLFAHLGMAGWVREMGASSIRLREHGEKPLDDETGRPRFLKLSLTADDGQRIVMTDGRRLARIWLGNEPNETLAISKLGPDCYLELPEAKTLASIIQKKTAPIKAILLDQAIFCGVGNWIADEACYQAGILPNRQGKELSLPEIKKLREALKIIVDHAVNVGADHDQFPPSWLFHYRWGGARGDDLIEGNPILRATVGGRTTAWVPKKQK
jgi:formamidopyrimidine-DNA glycosylase